jgi:hypothetical protein
MDTTLALAALVDQGWEAHADRPREVADALLARAHALPADADGAAALHLAEHVLLAHLADVDAYERLVDALAPALADAEPTAAMRSRMAWSLAMLRGRPAEALPDASRWRALHGLWSVAVARGEAGRALCDLQAEVPRALAHPEAAARQGLAATCNNLAGDLLDGTRGDAARDRLMLAAAAASRALWVSVGTWVNEERAEWMLSRCHAASGDGATARAHAHACLATIDAHADEPQADAFERFFAHQALAWAHRVLGDAANERAAVEAAAALLAQIADTASHRYCEGELAKLRA